MSALGGLCLPGGCLHGGCTPPDPGQTSPPPWTEILTHACENIAFPQLLLGAVINLSNNMFDTKYSEHQYQQVTADKRLGGPRFKKSE